MRCMFERKYMGGGKKGSGYLKGMADYKKDKAKKGTETKKPEPKKEVKESAASDSVSGRGLTRAVHGVDRDVINTYASIVAGSGPIDDPVDENPDAEFGQTENPPEDGGFLDPIDTGIGSSFPTLGEIRARLAGILSGDNKD